MPHAIQRPRRPSIEDRVREILRSLNQQVDALLVSRLADFVADYLTAIDPTEAGLIAEAFYRGNADAAELARAILGEALAEMSM
jgi:hypothetical protein